jgi:hypothetical protein
MATSFRPRWFNDTCNIMLYHNRAGLMSIAPVILILSVFYLSILSTEVQIYNCTNT